MSQNDLPPIIVMSIVFVTPDYFETIRTTMEHLQRQTIHDRLEIVIVSPFAHSFGMPDLVQRRFAKVIFVSVALFDRTGAARMAGVRAATAPIVAFAEDHSFPEPGWAEMLWRAHRLPRAAVAPTFINANPDTALSWANIFLAFAPWIVPVESGEMTGLPWHNTSYRRDLLLAYGERLSDMMVAEGFLQTALRTQGYVLYLEACARTHHQNIANPRSFILEHFYSGRTYASRRMKYENWSMVRKMIFALLVPFVPVVRTMRLRHTVKRVGKQDLWFRMLPWFMLGAACHSVGEFLGCFFGDGNSVARRGELEHHRDRHLA